MGQAKYGIFSSFIHVIFGNICFYNFVCICLRACVCVFLLGSCIRRLWRSTQTTLQTGTRTWHWPVRGCSAQVTRVTVQTACWPAAPSTLVSTYRRNPRIPRQQPYAQLLHTCSKRETSSARAGGKPHDNIQGDLHGAGNLRMCRELSRSVRWRGQSLFALKRWCSRGIQNYVMVVKVLVTWPNLKMDFRVGNLTEEESWCRSTGLYRTMHKGCS